MGAPVELPNITKEAIIAAPGSTKNEDKARDPEMHQTKKGNQWHYGMKAHIGVDTQSGLVHTVIATPANVNGVTQAGALLDGDEEGCVRRATAACTSARRLKGRAGTWPCSQASAGSWIPRARGPNYSSGPSISRPASAPRSSTRST